MLYEIDDELAFWRDLDYVGVMFDKRPVTFNIMDVASANTNHHPYGEQDIYHFRESLWNEVFIRYMGTSNLEGQILKQLDNSVIKPEKLTVND